MKGLHQGQVGILDGIAIEHRSPPFSHQRNLFRKLVGEFAGIVAADRSTRTYSTGMFLRLAFAISTSIEPDILIMDEMIASGDAKFIEKATRRLHELVDRANILALASHNTSIIETICNKVLWLEHGVVKQFGPSDTVVAAYEKAM